MKESQQRLKALAGMDIEYHIKKLDDAVTVIKDMVNEIEKLEEKVDIQVQLIRDLKEENWNLREELAERS